MNIFRCQSLYKSALSMVEFCTTKPVRFLTYLHIAYYDNHGLRYGNWIQKNTRLHTKGDEIEKKGEDRSTRWLLMRSKINLTYSAIMWLNGTLVSTFPGVPSEQDWWKRQKEMFEWTDFIDSIKIPIHLQCLQS